MHSNLPGGSVISAALTPTFFWWMKWFIAMVWVSCHYHKPRGKGTTMIMATVKATDQPNPDKMSKPLRIRMMAGTHMTSLLHQVQSKTKDIHTPATKMVGTRTALTMNSSPD